MKGVKQLKEAAMNHLIDLHGKKLFNFCLKLCKNAHDAEDLYQDTFLKAMEKLSHIDENNNPSAYLCSIAISLWRSKQRKAIRRQGIAPTVELEDYLHTDGGFSVEENVVKTETSDKIKEIILSLDEKMRVCVLLFYIYDMPLSEIARIQNCPEGTVKSRLHSARRLIKERLGKEHYDV